MANHALHFGSPWLGAAAGLGVLALALALGMPLLRASGSRAWRQPVDAALIACVLGLDAIAMAMLLSGFVRLPGPWLMRTALVAGVVATVWQARRHRVALAAVARRLRRRKVAVALSVVLLLMVGRAFCYPIGWDELVYHLALPARWLRDGQALVYLDNPYSALPSAWELILTLGLGAGNGATPGTLQVAMWLLTGACCYRLLRARCHPAAAMGLSVAMLLCNGMLTLASETYVELFLLVHLLAGLLVVRRLPRQGAGWGPVVVLAVLAACACGAKPTGIVVAPALLIAGWPRLRTVGWRRLAAVSVMAIVVAGVWYARPWAATGNPLYPYYARVFTPGNRTALLVSRYHHDLASLRYGGRSLAGKLTAPVRIAWDRRQFDGSLDWQWLLVLGLGAWGLWRRRDGWRLAVAGVGCWIFWAATAEQARFAMPWVCVAYVLAGAAVGGRRRLAYAVAAAALGLALVSFRPGDTRHMVDQWRVALGIDTMADYVAPWIGHDYVAAAEAVDRETPAGARVLVLIEKRTFYLDREAMLGTPYLQERFFSPPGLYADLDDANPDPAGVMKVLHEASIDYVLIGINRRDPDHLEAYDPASNQIYAAIAEGVRRGQLTRVWSEARYALIRVE